MAEEKEWMPVANFVRRLTKRFNEVTIPKIEAWRKRFPIRVTEEAEEAKEAEAKAEEEAKEEGTGLVRWPKHLVATGESKVI